MKKHCQMSLRLFSLFRGSIYEQWGWSKCFCPSQKSWTLLMPPCMDYGRPVRKSPSLHSHSQIFRYGRSIFCLPHQPKFSDIFDLCLHWVSVVRAYGDEEELYSINNQNLGFLLRSPCKNVHINYNNILAKPFCCKISSKMYGEFFYAWKIVRLGPGFDLPCKIY